MTTAEKPSIPDPGRPSRRNLRRGSRPCRRIPRSPAIQTVPRTRMNRIRRHSHRTSLTLQAPMHRSRLFHQAYRLAPPARFRSLPKIVDMMFPL